MYVTLLVRQPIKVHTPKKSAHFTFGVTFSILEKNFLSRS